MSSLSSDSSSAEAGGKAPEPKRKGGRTVKSRYLQYASKGAKKKDNALSYIISGSLNQSSFVKGDLQSTLLDGHKVSRLDLDLSAINDKSVHKKTPDSNSACDRDTESSQEAEIEEDDSHTQMEELESQTLLLTYVRVKAGKNLAELEEKAEKNLLMLCEEKERQQEKLHELKREILLKETEQKLEEALDKQMEILSPLIPVCEQFKEQYRSFALSLDAARHELPIKNIHIEGDTLTYLDKLQKQLTVTRELLTEVMPSFSEGSAEACNVLRELKDMSQKLDKELQRSFTQVQKLSFDVSKEVSLHNQSICEENHGLDAVKQWYFN
ncbi:HAUS augmin-like complex subunit 8 [Aegotheles albertisi]